MQTNLTQYFIEFVIFNKLTATGSFMRPWCSFIYSVTFFTLTFSALWRLYCRTNHAWIIKFCQSQNSFSAIIQKPVKKSYCVFEGIRVMWTYTLAYKNTSSLQRSLFISQKLVWNASAEICWRWHKLDTQIKLNLSTDLH